MIKRLVLVVASALVLAGVAHAALPALAVVVPSLEGVISGLVLRSAARQVVANVGVAANDASMVTTALEWINAARTIATISASVNGTVPGEIEVPFTTARDDRTFAAPGAEKISMQLFLPSYITKTGVDVDLTYDDFTLNEVKAKWLAAWNAEVLPSYQASGVVCNPIGGVDFECYPQGHPDFVVYTQPMQWERRDGVRRLKMLPDGWSKDLDDPDWSAADRENASSNLAKGTIVVRDDANGYALWVSRDAAGRARVESVTQTAPDRVAVRVIQLNPSAVPSAVSSNEAVGTVAAYDPYASPAGQGEPQNIVFPNDYAREATLSAGVGKLGELASAVASVEAADPADRSAEEYLGFGKAFDDLRGWSVPAHASTCPAPSVVMFGRSYTVDYQCTMVENHRALLSAAMLVFWSISALGVVLRA